MSIVFRKNNCIAHIKNDKLSYIIEVVDNKYLVHRYLGRPLRNYHCNENLYDFKRSYSTVGNISLNNVYFDDIPFEIPTRGRGDFRIPMLSIIPENGVDYLDLNFVEWEICKDKPILEGLPSTFGESDEVDTLKIVCQDDIAKIRVIMYYSVFREKGIIARHQKIENYGNENIVIQDTKSWSLDLPFQKYEWISLYGTYAQEANLERFPLHHGIQKIESIRGSSSPQHQPFFALASLGASEDYGEVFAFQLIYSGNFIGQVEMDQFGNVRSQIGINSDSFQWTLQPGESFTTPEAILNYSQNGLNEMSQNFHWLYQYHLMPRRFIDKRRPVLLNSWEGMYYDVSIDKIDRQTDLAKELGIDLFVLDDGWFRLGNTSESGIGDWQCNESKLPGGIKRISQLVHDKGMKFGLWFEPEVVNKNSQLYKQHPDWILHVPSYTPMEGRHEYVLDLSRKEVRDYIICSLEKYLKPGYLDYIKWDMNRPLTDVNSLFLNKSQKGEIYHRYILGLYEILDIITRKYPNLLIEGCSSGGARFDPGILSYVGQNWCSDNTDCFDRTVIQKGFSMLYPPVAMGAHVSITPNHQTGRETTFDARYKVAKMYNFGYELDLEKCSDEERDEICKQIISYKKLQQLIMNGVFYRHEMSNKNYEMWSICNKNKSECHVMIFQKMYSQLLSHERFTIPYLNQDMDYREEESNHIYGGDELASIGFHVPIIKEDFHVFEYHFKSC